MVVHLQIECSLRAGKVIGASEDEKYNFFRIAKKKWKKYLIFNKSIFRFLECLWFYFCSHYMTDINIHNIPVVYSYSTLLVWVSFLVYNSKQAEITNLIPFHILATEILSVCLVYYKHIQQHFYFSLLDLETTQFPVTLGAWHSKIIKIKIQYEVIYHSTYANAQCRTQHLFFIYCTFSLSLLKEQSW